MLPPDKLDKFGVSDLLKYVYYIRSGLRIYIGPYNGKKYFCVLNVYNQLHEN